MSHAQIYDIVKQLALVIGLGGVAVPYITAVINNLHWAANVKQAVMIGVAVVTGALTYLAQNDWQINNAYSLSMTIFGVITTAQAAYRGLWKKGIATAVTEARTTLASRVRGKTPVQTAGKFDDDTAAPDSYQRNQL